MAILQECPRCHTKQSNKNKVCKCTLDLDKAKRSKTVRFWISYRMPDGKQRRESVAKIVGCDPYSIKDARDADSKKSVQKRERRLFDPLPEESMTFAELCEWYLGLSSIKLKPGLYDITRILKRVKNALGYIVLADLKKTDIETYIADCKKDGKAASTIDKDIIYIKAILKQAFFDDLVSGRTLKVAMAVQKTGEQGYNARGRVMSIDEYKLLLVKANAFAKAYIEAAMLTGCRYGELRQLLWEMVDRKSGVIRLPAKITKTNRGRVIPITAPLVALFDSLPRSLSGFILCYKGNPLKVSNGNAIPRSFQAACNDAGILYGRNEEGGLIFHDIRRTVKTNMTTAGVPGAYRNVFMGHAQLGMDKHYFKPTEDDLALMMDRYADWLTMQLEGSDSEGLKIKC